MIEFAHYFFLQVVKYTQYSLIAYIQVLVTNICLNATWTAILTALLTTFHGVAFRVSSIVASVAGFASGFFIPVKAIHWGYVYFVHLALTNS